MTASGMRASDSDRDKVVEVLHTAYAQGRLDSDEHVERVQAAVAAKTIDELLPLTIDLVPRAAPASPARPDAIPSNSQEPERMTAALSEVKRVGRWRVPQRSLAHVFMGSVLLDLTEAEFAAPVVEVNITQFLGSTSLRVPLGVTVVNETSTMLGEFSVKGIGEPQPGYPTLVLRGTNVLGEIKVRGPKKPLLWKRALA